MTELNRLTNQVTASWNSLESAGRNQFVSINWDKVHKVAQEIAPTDFDVPNWRRDGVYPKDNVAFLSHVFVAGSQNFAFNDPNIPDGKYTVEKPGTGGEYFYGSEAMAHRIYAAFGEKVITTQIAAEYFTSRRGIDILYEGVTQIPFPELRLKTGRDLLVGLDTYFQGNPLNILNACTHISPDGKKTLRAFDNGGGLVELLISRFPVAYGADTQELDGMVFPFAKRAQLMAVLIHGRALDSQGEIPTVSDIDAVGPIADYQVPKPLRS